MLNISDISGTSRTPKSVQADTGIKKETPANSFDSILRENMQEISAGSNVRTDENTAGKPVKENEKIIRETEKPSAENTINKESKNKNTEVREEKPAKQSIKDESEKTVLLIESLIKHIKTANSGPKNISDINESLTNLKKSLSNLKDTKDNKFLFEKLSELKTILKNFDINGINISKKINNLAVEFQKEGVKTPIPGKNIETEQKLADAKSNITQQIHLRAENEKIFSDNSGMKNSGDKHSGPKEEFNFQIHRGSINFKNEIVNPLGVKNLKFENQLQEIISRAKITVKDGENGTFSMKLYPRSLGGLNVSLGLEHGILNGRFLVDNIEAKNLLLESLENMKKELENSGITLGEFQVNVKGGEEHFAGYNSEFLPFVRGKIESAVSSEYEINSMMTHDGALNLVI